MARRLTPSLSTLPLSVCPWRAFYPSPVRISSLVNHPKVLDGVFKSIATIIVECRQRRSPASVLAKGKKESRRFCTRGVATGLNATRLEAHAAMADAVWAYLSQPMEKHTLLPLARRPERRLGLVGAVGHAAR